MMRGFLLFTDKSTNFHFSRFVATMQSSAPSSEGSFREAIHVEPTGFASGWRAPRACLACTCLLALAPPPPFFVFRVSGVLSRARALLHLLGRLLYFLCLFASGQPGARS